MIFSVRRITRFVDDQIPKLMGTLLDVEQVLGKHVDDANIADGAITTALLADDAVTPAKTSGGIAQATSGTYIGDGTANRVIPLAFTPRYVLVVRTATPTEFTGLSDGTSALTQYWRDAAGAIASGAATWQGVITNGFKCGSGVGSASNVNLETYYFYAVA